MQSTGQVGGQVHLSCDTVECVAKIVTTPNTPNRLEGASLLSGCRPSQHVRYPQEYRHMMQHPRSVNHCNSTQAMGDIETRRYMRIFRSMHLPDTGNRYSRIDVCNEVACRAETNSRTAARKRARRWTDERNVGYG